MNVFVPVNVDVACTLGGNFRHVLKRLSSITMPISSFRVAFLPVLLALFLFGLDKLGSATAP